jgi:hypothetical protein
MKMKINITVVILIGILWGCSKMEDNYKQYIEETIYPGKVSNLKAQIGIERVYLKWDAPTDPKSSRIMVKYTETDSVITDSIVTKITISGLTESRGYEFDVSSLDDYGNKSVSSFVTVKPFSKIYVDNNILPTIPTFTFTTTTKKDPKTNLYVTTSTGLIKWEKISTSIMKFAKGNYSLSVTGVGDFSGNLAEIKKGIVEISLPDVDLHGKAIQFNYTIGLLPLQSDGKPIADTVTFNVNTDKIKMIN